jgi:hypothetical protein
MSCNISLLAAAAVAVAVATAPIASAAPTEQPCFDTGSTNCQTHGNVQIFTSPHPMPRVLPHSNNPKWRGLGYNPRWPALGHNPKWQDFGYNPRWNEFQTPLEVQGIRPESGGTWVTIHGGL